MTDEPDSNLNKPTTMQVIKDRAYDPETIVVPSELIEIRYGHRPEGLSLRAHKFLYLLIDEAGAAATEEKEHSVELAELSLQWHLSIDETIDIATELVQTTLVYTREVNGKIATTTEPLLYRVDRDHDAERGVLRFRLSNALIGVMRDSNHWAMLQRKVVLAFRSAYSLRLYELVSMRKGLRYRSSERYTLDELRQVFGVAEGTLSRWDHVKTKVLEKALAEVNQLSGFKVTYEVIKKSRSVVGVILSWDVATTPQRAEAAKELDRHSSGRKARREDTVEKVIAPPPPPPPPAFPETGSIEFTEPWKTIAKTHGQGWDVDQIANRFRGWCTFKGISLKQKGIEKTFEGFCKGLDPVG